MAVGGIVSFFSVCSKNAFSDYSILVFLFVLCFFSSFSSCSIMPFPRTRKSFAKKSLTSLTTSEILSCNKLKCNVLAVFCTVIDRRKIEVYPSPIPHHSCPCIGIASSAFVNSVLDKHKMVHTKKQSDLYVKPTWFVCKNKLCRAFVPTVPSVGTFLTSIYLLPDFQGRKLFVSRYESMYFL